MAVDSANRLVRATKPKNTTLCAGWFFGGPHQWSSGGARCSVKRRQKPPYQNKFTNYHEWGSDGKCVHCHKTKAEVAPKPSQKDRCRNCGLTRHEVKLLAKLELQPKLECEDFGHSAETAVRKAKRPALTLAVDNTRGATRPVPIRANKET